MYLFHCILFKMHEYHQISNFISFVKFERQITLLFLKKIWGWCRRTLIKRTRIQFFGSWVCVTAFGVFNDDNNLIDLNIDNLCKVCKMVSRFCQQQFEFNQSFVSYTEENTQCTSPLCTSFYCISSELGSVMWGHTENLKQGMY